MTDVPDEAPFCPHCGCEPDDSTLHKEGCPTLGTCAQGEPSLERPWHSEDDWWDQDWGHFTSDFYRHLREAHGAT